ncbi:MAG: hypothetical protein MJ077_11865 [Oscillospiraceae bacterium]|nr:hypothetical protein [Oscillospiraceae bacterium]
MKRRLIQTVQSVFVAADVTAAELVVMGLLKLAFHPVSAPALWLELFDFGAMAAFVLVIFLAEKAEMKPFEKLVLMLIPLVIVAVNVSQLFPLSSVWWLCFLLELVGAVLGGSFAACIKLSSEMSRIEERYALAVIEE